MSLSEEMAINEMAARRSFSRTMGKFASPVVPKPVAIITAFQGTPAVDAAGMKVVDPLARLVRNRQANRELIDDLIDLNLSYYPVKGAGQEQHRLFGLFRYVVPTDEESFVVQPIGDMAEADFLSTVQGLLHDYDQFAAFVKVPSKPQAFLLYQDGAHDDKSSTARPRNEHDRYYTQMMKGPRANLDMLSPWEIHGERSRVGRFINWLNDRSYMNKPVTHTMIGRRFVVPEMEDA
jgi:hypothetical protein